MRNSRAITSDDRKQLVVKSNDLIQKTRYQLSLQEQKILLFVISKIKPTDDDFAEYEFEMQEICDACGISYSGKNYRDLRDALKALHDKSFWLYANGQKELCAWVAKVRCPDKSNKIYIRLDETLKPYLIHIYENFTSYEVSCVLVMKSKYSVRMYELLKSYCYIGEVNLSLDELRDMLQCAEYADFRNFRRDVIDKALKEINKFTDINITYTTYRQGRSVGGFLFQISKKSSVEEVVVRVRREAELDCKA